MNIAPRRDLFDAIGHEFGAWGASMPAVAWDEPYDVEALLDRPGWHADALCAEPAYRPAWWFPAQGESAAPAKGVCSRCLVHDECKAWALAQGPELEGIWAGLSKADRHAIRMGRRAA